MTTVVSVARGQIAPAWWHTLRGQVCAHLATAADVAVLGGFWMLQSIFLSAWIGIDQRPPRWDESYLLQMTLTWSNAFSSPGLQSFHQALTFGAWKTTPNWLALMGLVMAITGDRSPDFMALVSNVLALGLIVFAVYAIGRRLYGRWCGVVAAFIMCSYPGILYLEHLYTLHMPLIAVVTLAIAGLVNLTRPNVRRRDLVFGAVTLGFAVGTRYQAVFFLWLPAIAVFFWQWNTIRRTASRSLASRVVIRRMAAIVVGASLFVVPFLVVARATFIEALNRYLFAPKFESFGGAAQYDGPALTWFSIGWYARSWVAFDFSGQGWLLWPVLAGIVVGLVWRRFATVLLGSWIAGAYFVFWMLVNKEGGYDLPYFPAFALLAAFAVLTCARWIGRQSRRAVPYGAAYGAAGVAIAGFCVANIAWYGFGLASPLDVAGGLWALARQGTLPVRAPDQALDRTLWRPSAERWPGTDLLASIDRLRAASGKGSATVAFIPNAEFFQVDSFRYFAASEHVPLTFVTTAWDPTNESAQRLLLSSDFVVFKSGDASVVRTGAGEIEEMTSELQDPRTPFGIAARTRFQPMAEYPLPDGSNAEILGPAEAAR